MKRHKPCSTWPPGRHDSKVQSKRNKEKARRANDACLWCTPNQEREREEREEREEGKEKLEKKIVIEKHKKSEKRGTIFSRVWGGSPTGSYLSPILSKLNSARSLLSVDQFSEDFAKYLITSSRIFVDGSKFLSKNFSFFRFLFDFCKAFCRCVTIAPEAGPLLAAAIKFF